MFEHSRLGGAWLMEVRTEDLGAGTARMGTLVLRGSEFTGTMTVSIRDAIQE